MARLWCIYVASSAQALTGSFRKHKPLFGCS